MKTLKLFTIALLVIIASCTKDKKNDVVPTPKPTPTPVHYDTLISGGSVGSKYSNITFGCVGFTVNGGVQKHLKITYDQNSTVVSNYLYDSIFVRVGVDYIATYKPINTVNKNTTYFTTLPSADAKWVAVVVRYNADFIHKDTILNIHN